MKYILIFSIIFSLLPLTLSSKELPLQKIVIDHSFSRIYKNFYIMGPWNKNGKLDNSYHAGYTKLFDDGTHGDETAGDYIFSINLHLFPPKKSVEFMLFSEIPEKDSETSLGTYTLEVTQNSNTHIYFYPDYYFHKNLLDSAKDYFNESNTFPLIFGFLGLLAIAFLIYLIILKLFVFIKRSSLQILISKLMRNNSKLYIFTRKDKKFDTLFTKALTDDGISNHLININDNKSSDTLFENIENALSSFDVIILSIPYPEIRFITRLIQLSKNYYSLCFLISEKATGLENENIKVINIEKDILKIKSFRFSSDNIQVFLHEKY